MKKQNGITLIALVITIIVLLILAGVSINATIGNNGILNRATEAVEKNEKARQDEEVDLLEMDLAIISNTGELNVETIKKVFEEKYGENVEVNAIDNNQFTVELETDEKYLIENDGILIKGDVLINTKEQLEAFRDDVNSGNNYEGKKVILTNDIDLEGSETNRNWTPIASTKTNKFCGEFDGRNHKIYNLYNSNTESYHQGFFGFVENATIKNLGIESGSIVARYGCGGIAGNSTGDQMIFENCYNKANLSAIWGIFGIGSSGSIFRYCYNEGDITATGCVNSSNNYGVWISGISNRADVVEYCYNKGNITSMYSQIGRNSTENR